jgi:cell division protease FtsH
MGPRTFGEREELIFLGREISEQRDYSEKTAQLIDKEIDRLVREAYAQAVKIIREQKKYLDKIASSLIEQETLEQEEFEALFNDLKVKNNKINKEG